MKNIAVWIVGGLIVSILSRLIYEKYIDPKI